MLDICKKHSFNNVISFLDDTEKALEVKGSYIII
jgi:hypothetical protein